MWLTMCQPMASCIQSKETVNRGSEQRRKGGRDGLRVKARDEKEEGAEGKNGLKKTKKSHKNKDFHWVRHLSSLISFSPSLTPSPPSLPSHLSNLFPTTVRVSEEFDTKSASYSIIHADRDANRTATRRALALSNLFSPSFLPSFLPAFPVPPSHLLKKETCPPRCSQHQSADGALVSHWFPQKPGKKRKRSLCRLVGTRSFYLGVRGEESWTECAVRVLFRDFQNCHLVFHLHSRGHKFNLCCEALAAGVIIYFFVCGAAKLEELFVGGVFFLDCQFPFSHLTRPG